MALTLDGTTGISATGNIYGNNMIVSNALTVGSFSPAVISSAGNVTGGNLITGGLISATSTITSAANITGGNFLTGGTISATANVTGGNILTGGIVSATGNITGSYILGNGSQLTGIDATSIQNGTSNAKVVSSGGNVSVSVGGTSNVAVFATTGEYITGVVSASGNVTGGNFLTGGLISATSTITSAANIIGGNVLTGGLISATSTITSTANITSGNFLTAGLISATSTITSAANITGGNLLTGGLISATGNVTGGNVNAGNITIAADLISSLGATLTIDPATVGNEGLVVINGNLQVNGTTTTINSNVVSTNDLTVNYANNAINSAAANGGGIEVGPIGSPYITWLYNNTANTWTTAGGISATGNITGGNVLGGANVNATTHTGTTVSVTGNITGGNLSVSTGTITVGNIVNANGNGVGNIGSSSVYFNTGFLKATTAQYADLAENYLADAEYTPGTVLDFDGELEVTISNRDSSKRVAGVVSTNPAHLMNGGLDGAHVVAVALVGRVPVQVAGKIAKGDLMVSAGNGRARAEANPVVGTVIGKALENFDSGEGTIEIVISMQ